MIKGLLLCLAMLVVQLGILQYVDRRVAAMPLLVDSTVDERAGNGAAVEQPSTRLPGPDGKRDA
ncbi:hypothetical protein [Billgrantia endophytica]|uniref:Uncharacterized protein n=1 Tax=Billgrantia endophytica TaxID=2033802 RepID=A0A2N7U386_9GAMM|nr:hypothetical protein [Halomonas endophytica]PMR74902.1 hypothetical protein C1H69_11820 [Halomonas endophytica]